jgi:hypothetical protein
MPPFIGRLLWFTAVVATIPFANGATSSLWGENGDRWKVDGRLPDFSRAGYHRGEAPIPTLREVANVKNFGAKGDGIADDTGAIRAAIAQTAHGAIYFPAGRYLITDFIQLTKSNVVLRGAGPTKTVFWFPRGLDEVHPKAGRTSTGSPASGYSSGNTARKDHRAGQARRRHGGD